MNIFLNQLILFE